MPEKKAQGTKKNEAATPDKKDPTPKVPEKIDKGNFYVFSCAGETISSGAKLTVAKVAETYDKKYDFIKNLKGARPEYLCVVERKSLFSRMPQIVVKEINTQ